MSESPHPTRRQFPDNVSDGRDEARFLGQFACWLDLVERQREGRAIAVLVAAFGYEDRENAKRVLSRIGTADAI